MAATMKDARVNAILNHHIDPDIDAGIVLSEPGIWEHDPTPDEFDALVQADLFDRGLARLLYANLETLVEDPMHPSYRDVRLVIRQRVPVITTAAPPHRYRPNGVHFDVPDHLAERVAAYYIGASIINPDRPFTIITEA